MEDRDLSVAERMQHTTELSTERAALVKATYGHLFWAVAAAGVGAYIGSTTPFILNLFSKWYGWVLALVVINAVPYLAITARHNPVLGFPLLLLDGFLAGIVLGPAVAIAALMAGDYSLVLKAGLMTLLIFTAVTAIIWTSGKRYSAPKGLMGGMFIALIGAVVLNMWMPGGMLGILISAGIGIFGVMILVYATSDILYDEGIDSPIIGAIMLFAGLFNVFTAILNILMAFGGGDD
ncbi:MAG: Bax inhibitor-1/YccA family protein [Calditrichia bacterium]